ncbi:hypothetical protein OIU77_026860 [Salix suchowensis]|uniref:Pentatricopeptide repeat-containing protein n=1 Tax=Salix suchowensis TaxID=1278906 RepID=A0ABQ9BMH4_9ROSI|nr:hypothetical protein OIU77_026860 [Salix suchowensis]
MPKCPPFITNSILKALNNCLYPIPSKFLSLSMPSNFSALAIPSTKTIEIEPQNHPQHRHVSDRENGIEHDPPISDKIFKTGAKMGSYKLEWLMNLSVKETVKSFNSVLNVIIQEDLFYRALEFYNHVIGAKGVNISPNVLTFNLVIKAMCKVGLVDDAVQMLRKMPVSKCQPDAYTYSTLMDGLCKADRIDEAVSLLDEMQIDGCFPSPVTFNVLINGLCKKGDLSRVAKLVDNMFLKGCVPNEVTYNTLIHGLCLKGKLEKAISLLDSMVSSKCVPNVVTYGTVINGLVKQGRALDGARVLASMEERGYHVNDSLMKGFFEADNGHKAIEVWKDMAKHNCTQNESSISRAIDLLNSMLDRGCDPDLVTCIIFLRALREKLDPPQDGGEFLDGLVVRLLKRQRVLGAAKIVEVMLQKILPPKLSTWARAVEDLCKPKKVQAAIQKCWNILYC